MLIFVFTLYSTGASLVIPHYHEQDENHFQDAEVSMVAHHSFIKKELYKPSLKTRQLNNINLNHERPIHIQTHTVEKVFAIW